MICAKIVRRDKPTKHLGWIRRRAHQTIRSIQFASMVVCVGKPDYPRSLPKMNVDMLADGSGMEFFLQFDSDWSAQEVHDLMRYMKNSKNIVSALLTSAPEPATIPA